MNWITWIRGVLSGRISQLAALANIVRHVGESLYTIIRILGQNVAKYWGSLRYQFVNAPRYVLDFVNQGVQIARWFAYELVPRWAKWAWKTAIDYAVQVHKAVDNFIKATARGLTKLANDLVNTLRAFVLDWIRNFQRIVNDVKAILSRVAELVFGLLTHPTRLITWILPFLIGPLARYIDSRRDAIGRWILDRLIGLLLFSAARIESTIARLF